MAARLTSLLGFQAAVGILKDELADLAEV